MNYLYLFLTFYVLFIVYKLIKQNNINNRIDNFYNMVEEFNDLNDTLDTQSVLASLSLITNDNNIYVSGLEVGDLIIDGTLTVNKGSDFSGGRHYFQDEENAGRLRVGELNNVPGIYAEDGKFLAIGSSGGKIFVNDNLQTDKYYFERVLNQFFMSFVPRF